MINRATVKVVYVGLLVFAASLAIYAQDRPADSMQIVHEAIRAEKKLLISQNMQLTEAEAAAFWPVYERYQHDLQQLLDRRVKLIKEYAANYPNLSDAVAQKLLDDFMAQEEDRVRLSKSYLPQFRKVLSATKVARYYQLENKVRAVMDYEMAANIPIIQ